MILCPYRLPYSFRTSPLVHPGILAIWDSLWNNPLLQFCHTISWGMSPGVSSILALYSVHNGYHQPTLAGQAVGEETKGRC